MGEKETLTALEMPGLSEEEIAALEAERNAAKEADLAPAKEAAKMRKESADIIAEHDNMLAELLFEITVNETEG